MNKTHIIIEELGSPIRTKKLSYKGQTEEYKVYRVPIDKLYFNDENGRIATFMSQYESEHPGTSIHDLSNNDYNSIIAGYIEKANSADSFKRTLNDIKLKGQLEAGVILDNGRVIDGNRRFTCLRKLYEETNQSKYYYFECVILPTPNNDVDRKELRTLELSLQFGVDEKVTYSAIDRLVSIYNDILGPKKIYDEDEYQKRFGIKANDLKLLIIKTNIMIDYLQFIDKPMKFYIARDYKIDGPIQELVTLKKTVDEAEWDRIKIGFYYWFDQSGDTTRFVRNSVKLYKNNPNDFNKHLDKVVDNEEAKKIEELKEKYNKPVSQVKEETVIKKKQSEDEKKIAENFENLTYDLKQKQAREKPLELVRAACKKINEIDKDIVKRLKDDELKNLESEIYNLQQSIDSIKGNIKQCH